MTRPERTACECARTTAGSGERALPGACPACGHRGKTVPERTVRLHVRPSRIPVVVAGPHRFCETPDCPIVYYGHDGAAPLGKADLRSRVGVKERDDPVPVCYCFGFTEQDIVEDVLANGASTVRAYIEERVRDGDCACQVTNPSGRCCLANVARAVKAASAPAAGEVDPATSARCG